MAESTHHTEERAQPQTVTLSDIFGKVEVTETEGAAILQALIVDMSDQNLELHGKIQKSIQTLLYG